MGKRRDLATTLGIALVLASCTSGGEQRPRKRAPVAQTQAVPRQLPAPEADPAYPGLDPAHVEALEVLMFEQPVGEGYRKVNAELGPVLYSGKWLGLASGEGRFLGSRHVIVNVFSERPAASGPTPTRTNLILDFETGEVAGEFEHLHRAQWHHGLLLVRVKGDARPYLFDVASEKLVLALPEGDHEWELGRNYWLRFSSVAKRVWITAKAADDSVHIYAWEPLHAPPESPSNPFPFLPDAWDPDAQQGVDGADFEEVSTQSWEFDCVRAVLRPPKGFECLEDFDLQRSVPLSDGWRLHQDDLVFNSKTGEGYDLNSLCPLKGHDVLAWVERRSPPRVRIRCGGNTESWLRWTPPDHVVQLAPELAGRINVDLWLNNFEDEDDLVELEPFGGDGSVSEFEDESKTRVLVGHYSECSSFIFRGHSASERLSAVGCENSKERIEWLELHDHDQQTRARLDAQEVLIGPFPRALALTRRAGVDELRAVRVVEP